MEICEVFDRVGSCKENVRRNIRYELRAVRSLLKDSELRAVRSLFGECEVFDRVGSCKENVRRNVRYLIELRAVRSLLEGFRGIRLS